MKIKILGIVLAVFFMAGIVYAQDKGLLDDFPNVKTGVAWNLANEGSDELLSLTTVDVVTWKKKLALGAGFITKLHDDDNINPAVSLTYAIGGLEKWGFDYPLANLVNIDVGVFASKEFNGGDHWRAGVCANIIKIKF